MGTFHHDTHELHGITCVVDLVGPRLVVGRVDRVEGDALVLLDADVHEDRPGGPTKAEYVRRAAEVGVWKRHDRLLVPLADVASVRRLGEM